MKGQVNSPQVIDSTTTREGDTVTVARAANGKTKIHFDLSSGSSFDRKIRAAAEKAGMPLDKWIAGAFEAEVARLKALEAEPLKVSAKSTAVFVAAARVLGVTPAEVADHLIGSIARELDDPEHGLLSDMAAGCLIPLDPAQMPAIRARFIKWAEVRKMPRKRAVRHLADGAAA